MDDLNERIFNAIARKFDDVRTLVSKQNSHIQKLQREVEELRVLAGLQEPKGSYADHVQEEQ